MTQFVMVSGKSGFVKIVFHLWILFVVCVLRIVVGNSIQRMYVLQPKWQQLFFACFLVCCVLLMLQFIVLPGFFTIFSLVRTWRSISSGSQFTSVSAHIILFLNKKKLSYFYSQFNHVDDGIYEFECARCCHCSGLFLIIFF